MRRALLSLTLLAALAVTAPAVAAGPAVVLTSDGRLVTFDPAAPSVARAPVAVSGLVAGEALVGIDVRPQTGVLYGLGVNATANTASLYVLEPTGGVAVPVLAGGIALQNDASIVVDLPDPSTVGYGFDFSPAADRIRVVAGALNFRIDPNLGSPSDANPGAPGSQPDGATNGATTSIDGAAYTNNRPNGGGVATLYTLDSTTNRLFTQNPPNNGTQTTARNVTLAGAPLDFASVGGFDIPPGVTAPFANQPVAAGSGLAALTVAGQTQLYELDLVTGAATARGAVAGVTGSITGLALYGEEPLPAIALSASGLDLLRFSTSTPGTVVTQPLASALVGIDRRPQTGQLLGFAVNPAADTGTLYVVDPQSGATTAIGAPGGIAFTTDGATPVDLPDPATVGYGMDVDPVTDRVRITTTNGLNFRVNPFTGDEIDGNNGSGASVTGFNPDGPVDAPGGVGDVAYTNAFTQAPTVPAGPTTLYALEPAGNRLFRMTPPNAGSLTGPLALFDLDADSGFDIPGDVRVATSGAAAAGTGYLAATSGGVTGLARVALGTGAVTPGAAIGTGSTGVAGLALGAVAPVTPPPPGAPPRPVVPPPLPPSGGGPGVPPPPGPPVTLRPVTLKLAQARIGRRGPVRVTVTNPNASALRGRLSARTSARVRVGKRRRLVTLTARTFRVAARRSTTVSLSLPASLRTRLRRDGRLSLRVTATAPGVRSTVATLTPRLRR